MPRGGLNLPGLPNRLDLNVADNPRIRADWGFPGPTARPRELCHRLDSVVEHGLHDAIHPTVETVIDAGCVLQ